MLVFVRKKKELIKIKYFLCFRLKSIVIDGPINFKKFYSNSEIYWFYSKKKKIKFLNAVIQNFPKATIID